MLKKNKKPTVRDVGRHAKCSPATVSRAINNTAPVSAEVRRNVLDAMRKLGYAPWPAKARNGNGKTPGAVGPVTVILYRREDMEPMTIREGGVIVKHSEHVPVQKMLSKSLRLSVDFHMHIISGVVEELAAHGVESSLRIVNRLDSPELIAEVADPSRGGVVLLGEYGGEVNAFVEATVRPLVLADILHDSWPDVVTTDNDAGIGMAMDHLVSLGHTRIGFVGCSSNPSYREREEAFDRRIAARGLPNRREWRYDGSSLVEEAVKGVQSMMREKERPTAILCVADYLAMGVIRTARRNGLRIPEDLSVVGFDDIDASSLVDPPLTTVHVPTREMGQRAARQLMQAMQLGAPSKDVGCTLRLRPQLVVRGSTAAPQSRDR